MTIRDARVLITGGAGGIGSATARLAARRGAQVIVADIDGLRAAEVADEIGDRAMSVVLDVTDPMSWQRVLDEADERFGDVDVLINNAGIDVVGEFGDTGLDQDRRMIEVNLLGSITGIKTLLPRMRARASGHVITISSMQAFVPMPGQATYAATKHALRALDFVLAYELRDEPIDFTIVYPPAVDTPMFEALLDHDVSAASFAAPSLSADQLATSIVDAIEDRPREVYAPSRVQGKVARFMWSQPALLRRLIPILEKRGRADLERRRSERGGSAGKGT
jgi:short-subunit dehydrogenase